MIVNPNKRRRRICESHLRNDRAGSENTGPDSAQCRHDRRASTLRRTIIALSLVVILASAPSQRAGGAESQVKADLVIVNARIWTGEPGSDPNATAVAVKDGGFVAIGDDESVASLIGSSTRQIDAEGRRVIPGITDSHTHIIGGGLQLARISLRDVADKRAFVRAVAEDASNKQEGEWVLGGRWSVDSWPDPSSPDKGWLDPVTGNTPVFLSRMDGHQALVNSAALRIAGITARGPDDPVGGQIVRDEKTGEPTGILKESAMELVRRHIPAPSPDQRYEALKRAMRHANEHGVTAIQDLSEPLDLAVFGRAHRDNSLTIRITAYLSVETWSHHIPLVKNFPIKDNWLRVAGLKGYMDGSLGSHTAYMRHVYDDLDHQAEYPRGQLTAFAVDQEKLRGEVTAAMKAGLQPAIHAIGDEANHLLLDAYEHALESAGKTNLQPRIEHVQHLLESDIERFAKLGVVASMQPAHKADDARYAEKRIGEGRLAGSYAYRRLVDSGAIVIFGSDWPVVTLNPFAGIDAAVTARSVEGRVWLPSHSLSVKEALHAYTLAPARAIGKDGDLGSIAVGKRADLVILADDLMTIPDEKLGDVRVAMTIVDGRVVYQRGE